MALTRIGFTLQTVDDRRMVLVRDGRRVCLPRRRVLGAGELVAVLRIARVTEAELVQALPVSKSGTFRRTDFAPLAALADEVRDSDDDD